MNILILMNIAVIVGGLVICLWLLWIPQGSRPDFSGWAFLFTLQGQSPPGALELDDSGKYAPQDVLPRPAETMLSDGKTVSSGNPVLDAILGSRPVQPDTDSPACPKCSATMVKRETLVGDNTGRAFWACSTFPRCGQMEEIGAG
jgi:hypothetical protein